MFPYTTLDNQSRDKGYDLECYSYIHVLQVLFFGDSMRSDTAPAKHAMGWETVLILEEIIAEHNPETGKDAVEKQVRRRWSYWGVEMGLLGRGDGVIGVRSWVIGVRRWGYWGEEMGLLGRGDGVIGVRSWGEEMGLLGRGDGVIGTRIWGYWGEELGVIGARRWGYWGEELG